MNEFNSTVMTDAGGFPIDNIAYWKTEKMRTAGGSEDILLVQFRSGGFIYIPNMTVEQFNSLVSNNLHEEMLQVKKRYEQVGVVLVIICILQLINLVLGFL